MGDLTNSVTLSGTKQKSDLSRDHATNYSSSDAGLNEYTGSWDTSAVVHLLKRTMFGASKSDVDYFKNKTMQEAVDELLQPLPLPSPPLKDYDTVDGASPADSNIAPGTTWVYDLNMDIPLQYPRRQSFQRWWVGLIINQERNIREKMNLFWHNHFATNNNEVGIPGFVYKHHTMLRKNCLGNFKSLIKPVTTDPAMLIYLNGYLNVGHSPDENYARELQELFTIGKESSPNYDEEDVRQAARVLTGWQWDKTTNSSHFNRWLHDPGDKQFSSFYNNTKITGEISNGEKELDDLIEMIFSKQKEVARFITGKIYRYFCYYHIDESTQNNIIEPLADIFINNNWEIRPVLSALFKSDHFYSIKKRGNQVKSPVELVAGMCREFNIKFPDTYAFKDAYNMWEHIFLAARSMGQELGAQPNVAGWPAYYQTPGYNRLWINSDTITKRTIFIDQISLHGYTMNNATILIDPVAFAKTLPNPGDPDQLINDSLDILFQVPLADVSKQSIKKEVLLGGQENNEYWTRAWIVYLSITEDPPVNNPAYQTVYIRLRSLYSYFMNLPEYQLQ